MTDFDIDVIENLSVIRSIEQALLAFERQFFHANSDDHYTVRRLRPLARRRART